MKNFVTVLTVIVGIGLSAQVATAGKASHYARWEDPAEGAFSGFRE